MSVRQAALRPMVAGAFLCSVLSAPGLARAAVPPVSADLQLTGGFTPVVVDKTTTPPTKGPPTKIDFGKSLTLTYTLKSLAGHSTGVQLDAPVVPAGTTVTDVSGATCATDPTTGALVFPCPISPDLSPADPSIVAPAVDPNVLTIVVTLSLDVPKTPSAAICAGTTPLGDVTVSVSNDPKAAAGPTTDTNPANNTVTTSGAAVFLQPFSDVGVTLSGPDRVGVGSQTTITTTVTNNGPCTAKNVGATFIPGNLLQFVSGAAVSSGPGAAACAAVDPTVIDAEGNNATCTIGDMTAGQVVTWSDTYKLKSLPEDVIQTTIPNEVDVATDSNDVNGDNDVATIGTRTGKEAGGCSTGGPAGLAAVALMGLAVLAARRRRVA